MTAVVLDGKGLAERMQMEISREVAEFASRAGRRPGLAAVLVGNNPASQTYVRNKRRACDKIGMVSWLHELPESVSPGELLSLIGQLNESREVDGILVQLPLPKSFPEAEIVDSVHPLKDVDGFGVESLGLLTAGRPRYLACTPHGVLKLLDANSIPTSGQHVVIAGRSNIVGKPLALMLLRRGSDATVTVCHSQTADVGAFTRQADIIVMAIGQPHYLKGDMVRPGAIVIDVGTNRLATGKLVGDVDFDEVRAVAAAITPVPGGVGPMTITMLLYNTLQAARIRESLPCLTQ